MNKDFVIVDRLNSVAFQCSSLIRFIFNNIDYLVYYSYEKDNKCKVFTSRIICNCNNKYSLNDISSEEKNKISSIVSAIIVTFPSSYSKNLDINKFVNDFTFSNNIFFSKDIPNLEEQSLYSNSFFAYSSVDYLNYARSFYNYILSNVSFSNRSSLIWSIPSSDQDISINRLDNIIESSRVDDISTSSNNHLMDNMDVIIPISGFDTDIIDNDSDYLNKNNLSVDLLVNNNSDNTNNYSSDDFGFSYVPKITEDSSSSEVKFKFNKDKMLDKKNAGFASNGYIIIGTVCLILASIVVAAAIIIIKKLR